MFKRTEGQIRKGRMATPEVAQLVQEIRHATPRIGEILVLQEAAFVLLDN
jgi:hypothetical protein